MVTGNRRISWDKQATIQLKKAIQYIREDSPQNADKVKGQILSKINDLSEDKVVHRKDSYKKNNDGNYLYFEILKYRIVYYVEPKEVFILRVRHTAKEPKTY